MIAGYLPGPTWLHQVPTGAKLVGLALASLAILPVKDPFALSGLLALVVAIYASLGREAWRRLALLKPLLPFLAIIGLLQGWLVSWSEAATMILRVLVMVLAASLVTLTSTMQAMVDTLRPLMSPLRFVGVNPRAPALAVALLIRFVPVLMELWGERGEAWRARTGRRASLRLVPAFVAETLRMADAVAEALDAKGFDVLHRPRSRAPALRDGDRP